MSLLRRIGLLLFINFLVMVMVSVVIFVLSYLGFRIDGAGYYLVVSLVFGFGGSFISLWMSKGVAKRRYKVQLIDPNTASGRELFVLNAVRKMASQHQIRMPEVGIFDATSPNAFATGATKNSALVAFSSSLVNSLSEDELAAVAGHEMTHILKGDMVTMSLIIGVVNTFVMFLSYIVARALDAALRDKRGRGGLGFFGYRIVYTILQNVLLLLAYIPISYYSRQREYRADKGAAEMVSPRAMISALRALDVPLKPETNQQAAANMAMINNKRKVSLYSTHPSIEDRIKALEKML